MEERRSTVRRQEDRELRERVKEKLDGETAQRRKRRAIRHNCRAVVELEVAHSAGSGDDWTTSKHKIPGRIIDLSEEGAAVFTQLPIAVNQRFRLNIKLYDGAVIETQSEARWTQHKEQKNGYLTGALFTHIDPANRKRIVAFLKELDETMGL